MLLVACTYVRSESFSKFIIVILVIIMIIQQTIIAHAFFHYCPTLVVTPIGVIHTAVIAVTRSQASYQPATCEARSQLVLRLLYGFHICLCVALCTPSPTYHVCNNDIM